MILACLASVGHAEEKQRFSGQQSGVKKPAQKVIDNLETWKKVWREVHQAVSPKPKLPKVDFEKQVVLAVFMGEKNTGGYRIQIRGMKDTGKKDRSLSQNDQPPTRWLLDSGFDAALRVLDCRKTSEACQVRGHPGKTVNPDGIRISPLAYALPNTATRTRVFHALAFGIFCGRDSS